MHVVDTRVWTGLQRLVKLIRETVAKMLTPATECGEVQAVRCRKPLFDASSRPACLAVIGLPCQSPLELRRILSCVPVARGRVG